MEKIIKNITAIFLVYIILGGYAINELAIGETLTKEIRIQIKPIYEEIENKKRDTQLNGNYYQSSHIKYQDIKNTELTDKLKNTVSENVQSVEDDKFNINLLNDVICKNIKNNLVAKYTLITNDNPDIIIEVMVEKTTVNSLYGPELIADVVTYKGKSLVNDKVIFSGEFKQDYNFPFGSIKPPEQIGKVLAKRIVNEIKKLKNN
jgi:hypothetical protein